jgi:O-antigen ligase
MIAENPEALVEEESPLIASAPAHVRLTQRQRSVLIFLAFAVPLWVILALLMTLSNFLTIAFVGGLLLLVVIYGMPTEYLLFLWFALVEYSLIIKVVGIQTGSIGLKGLFFAAVLSQLPNKFSLMPRRLFRTVPARWPLYLFLLWTGISLIWSRYFMFGLRAYLRWLMVFFLYAMVFLTINERNKRLFFIVFAVVIGSSVLFGFLQYFGLAIPLQDTDLFEGYEVAGAGGMMLYRVTGFSGHPNGLGRECVSEFLVLLVMLLSWRLRPLWRSVVVGMLVITLATMVLSYSRVAWGIFAVGIVVFLVLTRPRWLIPMALIGMAVALVAWPEIWARIEPVFAGTDASMSVRERASRIYMEYWRQRPIVGYGMGSAGGGALFEAGIVPHEGYISLLSRFGVVGLVLFVLVLLGVLRAAWVTFRRQLGIPDAETRAVAGLAMTLAVILSVEFIVAAALYPQLWYLLGVSFGVVRLARRRNALALSQAPAKAPPS